MLYSSRQSLCLSRTGEWGKIQAKLLLLQKLLVSVPSGHTLQLVCRTEISRQVFFPTSRATEHWEGLGKLFPLVPSSGKDDWALSWKSKRVAWGPVFSPSFHIAMVERTHLALMLSMPKELLGLWSSMLAFPELLDHHDPAKRKESRVQWTAAFLCKACRCIDVGRTPVQFFADLQTGHPSSGMDSSRLASW